MKNRNPPSDVNKDLRHKAKDPTDKAKTKAKDTTRPGQNSKKTGFKADA